MGPAAARAGLRARAAPVGGRGAAWLRVSEFVDGPRPRALTNIEKCSRVIFCKQTDSQAALLRSRDGSLLQLHSSSLA